MRALEPARSGVVESHGVPIAWGLAVRMDYEQTDPEALAPAIADGLKRPALYRDVETDGARRAAARIARLL